MNNPFARLLGMQRTAHARERLLELRTKHALTEDDPIWDLVAVVEDFCVQLRESTVAPALAPPAPHSSSRSLGSSEPWRIAVLGSAAASLQTLLLSVSFVAGARAVRTDHWLPAALSIPAGWVMFVLMVPLLVAIAYLGWRVRRSEPAVGWTLVISGTATALGLFITLWMTL